ncbi:hypothetical protein LCGC14_2887860 [marine sediment metagenome]|uniref:Uncharacterized protein n=1 Tax=marine sediment metagenome TaxID=412755 RepID=A0A0F9AP96_9ZZZZ
MAKKPRWKWPNNLVGWMKFSGAVITLATIIVIYVNLPIRMTSAESDLESLEEIANFYKWERQQQQQQVPMPMPQNQQRGWIEWTEDGVPYCTAGKFDMDGDLIWWWPNEGYC